MPSTELHIGVSSEGPIRRTAHVAIVRFPSTQSIKSMEMLVGRVNSPKAIDLQEQNQVIHELIQKYSGELLTVLGGTLNPKEQKIAEEEEQADTPKLFTGERRGASREVWEEVRLHLPEGDLVWVATGVLPDPLFPPDGIQKETLFLFEYSPKIGEPTPTNEISETLWLKLDDIAAYRGLEIRLAFFLTALHLFPDAITPEIMEKLHIPSEFLDQVLPR